jgi:OFA family oxalate/formate antiporter-like MFS transporter
MCFLINGLALNIGGNLRGAYIVNAGIILVNAGLIVLVKEHRYNRDYLTEYNAENAEGFMVQPGEE